MWPLVGANMTVPYSYYSYHSIYLKEVSIDMDSYRGLTLFGDIRQTSQPSGRYCSTINARNLDGATTIQASEFKSKAYTYISIYTYVYIYIYHI